MSAATSPGTGLAYGLQRVCAAWGFARSSFYAMKSRQQATAERPPAKRRGPKPSISDEALLVAIEADLEASPWEGEGHRKVWARLRVCRGIRVSRKRGLRVMRENNLLSPHRCRRRGGNPHVGEIITHAPNLMWGTDGVRVFTVDDGWGWIFTAIEHWNAECVGWHVCKRGDRFAALQPISMGLARLYASTSAGAARGLALRMDHGSQYLSDHFTNQIKFWGIQPSYAFVETAPDQRRRREVQSHAQGTDHPWPHLPQHRGAAERRPRVRRTVQCPVDRGEERLPEPRSSSSGVAHRDVTQARRMRQTCVQGTGCDTIVLVVSWATAPVVPRMARAAKPARNSRNTDLHMDNLPKKVSRPGNVTYLDAPFKKPMFTTTRSTFTIVSGSPRYVRRDWPRRCVSRQRRGELRHRTAHHRRRWQHHPGVQSRA